MEEQDNYEDLSSEVPIPTVTGRKSPSTYSEPASITEQQTPTCSQAYDNICLKYCQFQLSPSNENVVAFFWAVLIFFIGLIFIVAQYTTTLQKYDFQTTYWMLFVFMWLSIIGLSVAIRNRNNENFIKDIWDDDNEDEHSEEAQSNYLIGNAYVFAGGNFLLDMFSMVTVFHCSLGTGVVDRKMYIVKFFFHSSRIIFTSLQLVFLQIFMSLKVNKKYRLQFKVLVVQTIATNFLIWFTFLCQETGILKGNSSNVTGEYSYNCSSNPGDSVYETAKSLNETLQPFILEFSLLAASLLYSLCPLKILSAAKDRAGGRLRKYYGATDHVKRDASKRYKCDPGLLIGIFIALLLILSSWSLEDEDHYIQDLRFNYSMQIIIQCLIIISCCVILHELRKNHSKNAKLNRKYRIDDYLLLITGPCGALPFLFTVLFSLTKKFQKPESMSELVANDLSQHETEVKGLLGFLTILNIVSVLTQTFFLLEAHSYDRMPVSGRRRDSSYNEQDDDSSYYKLRSSARIGQLLFFLLVINLAIWVTDSFFELRHDLGKTYGIAQAYWNTKTWGFISKLLYPIIIFFRFHSVALIAHIWSLFQIKKKIL